MKKFIKFSLLSAIFFISSCGGGGDGSTRNYSGTWNVQGTLESNNCPFNMPGGVNFNISVNQDGEDIVLFDGINTYIGKTTWFDYDEIIDGFAAGHTFSNGSMDHIYVTHIKGKTGSFTEIFYGPGIMTSNGTERCLAVYRGTGQKLD